MEAGAAPDGDRLTGGAAHFRGPFPGRSSSVSGQRSPEPRLFLAARAASKAAIAARSFGRLARAVLRLFLRSIYTSLRRAARDRYGAIQRAGKPTQFKCGAVALIQRFCGVLLEGDNASLRYAHTLVANLAKHEARRMGNFVSLDAPAQDGTPHPVPAIDPDPPSDPALRRAILDCIEKLPGQPRRALGARLRNDGLLLDRDLADEVGMTLNTFHQNIVHARRHLADCLESRGMRLSEVRA